MRLSEIAAWIAIVLIQGASIPAALGNILGLSKDLPPLSMVALLWVGLGLFLWRSIEAKDKVNIASNGIGFFIESVMIYLIIAQH